MASRLVFISMMFGVITVLIYFARSRLQLPGILNEQRKELLDIAGLINGIENSVEGDRN